MFLDEHVCPDLIPHETFCLTKKSPNRALLIGQSGAGKSYFLKELCQNYRSVVAPKLTDKDEGFVFVYSYQTVKPELKLNSSDTIFYILGLPTVKNVLEVCQKFEDKTSGVVLILDDVLSAMESLSADETNEYQKLIVEWSRIKNIHIYIAVQNSFSTSKVIRVFKRNMHQLLLFSVLSAESSVMSLATQVVGLENKKLLKDAYRQSIATQAGYYGFLLIDFTIKNQIVQRYRMRNIFSSFSEKRTDLKSLFREDICLYQLK